MLAEVTRRRQNLLSNRHRVHAVIDESVLLRMIGTTNTMAAQLAHLRDLTTSPSCELRILAMTGPHRVLTAPFAILSFPDPADPDVACHAGSDGQVTLIKRSTVVSALRSSFDAMSSAAMPVAESASLISEVSRKR